METFFIWFILILISYFCILYVYLHFSNKENIYNNLLGFGATFWVFIHILIILLLMFQDESLHNNLVPLWLFTLGFPLFIIGALIVISTLIVYLYNTRTRFRDLSKFIEKMQVKLKNRSKVKNDTYRKIPHILIFIGLLAIWFLGASIINSITGSTEGMIPFENDMFLLYLQIFTIPNIIQTVLLALGWFYYLLFFFFYIFCIFMFINEFTRKTNFFKFPFNIFCRLFLCEEERDGYGTYLYFAIGQMFAALLCPPMVFFAILGMSSIADLMSSQIGLRYGKKKIRFNNKKTWEGALAGFLASFTISFFFVGIIWALIFAVIFLIIDIITHKPINLSDNLLIPIGMALIYVFIRFFFNLNYFTIILW